MIRLRRTSLKAIGLLALLTALPVLPAQAHPAKSATANSRTWSDARDLLAQLAKDTWDSLWAEGSSDHGSPPQTDYTTPSLDSLPGLPAPSTQGDDESGGQWDPNG